MGLRCLIGHEYGDAQTERDRRQQGSEVVVTVREFRECTRCGHRRIISENKEITADRGPPLEPTAEPTVDAEWSASADRVGPDAADEPVGAVTAGGVGFDEDEQLTAEEDDGVILEDESEEPGRGYGQWPEADLGDDEPSGDYAAWPDAEAPAPETDSEAEADTVEPTAAEADSEASGATDPAAVDPDESAEVLTDDGDEPTRKPSSAATDQSPADSKPPQPSPDPMDIELVCPDCESTWPSMNVSLRRGDICPECRTGYLEERVIQ